MEVLKGVRGTNVNRLHDGIARYVSLEAIGELFRSRTELVRAAIIEAESA